VQRYFLAAIILPITRTTCSKWLRDRSFARNEHPAKISMEYVRSELHDVVVIKCSLDVFWSGVSVWDLSLLFRQFRTQKNVESLLEN
jgi:hypothetical protein